MLFDCLTERELEVVKLRFGFYGRTFYSHGECARVLGTEPCRVKSIETRALSKLPTGWSGICGETAQWAGV